MRTSLFAFGLSTAIVVAPVEDAHPCDWDWKTDRVALSHDRLGLLEWTRVDFNRVS